MDLLGMVEEPARRAGLEARSVLALARAGVIGVEPPHRLLSIIGAIRDFGPFGGAPRISALRHAEHPAIADERGEISYRELDELINRLADALRSEGLEPGASIGILCRNHRWPLVVAFAASRSGMKAIWLNTSFSARQAAEVAEREGVDLLVLDEEFAEMVAGIDPPKGKVVCSIDNPAADELDRLVAKGRPGLPPAPAKPGRIVLLTSGTSGTPKGAPRPDPKGFIVPGSLLERMPMKAREANVIGPPLFHGTGLLIALLSVALGSKTVLRRRFDPATFLDDIERHRVTGVCVVPVMLQRVLALGDEKIAKRDLSSLRVVFCAGSQLPAEVAIKAMDLLGDVIYNLYGSTEVAVATLATPQDIRIAPTSVGKPTLGSRVKIIDERGNELPKGERGRIFVGTTMPFEGYTGGGSKEVIDGLMSTGDVGHFDDDGRLYVDGRDDEMIVSGGENVFPREVEELLVTHPAIADAAAVGVEDESFGQRLRAFVVIREGEAVSVEDVQAFVKDNLARYKVPRDVIFLDELPRNPTGKILKRELLARQD
ncbi:MAG TPA: AMP-binding protein [Solirubrobacteraceae bacterium]|jgi:fatty-acyl-CoA synthase|nr:AMP-binding protein [Solirubrobacteraceae bacterium]